ncbi:hypothetical protein LOK49_LG11G00303 [Camellia lanceoleosa]|uniref:Uncharacterized protein n=1 Tax=Camellia lanceoleosa TaxID=1840588 RepID=A0ACC0G115_9ERIC|nr:hypothetical protein LOK49_LG11G00303 [Camellia lanceoleosa]
MACPHPEQGKLQHRLRARVTDRTGQRNDYQRI